MAIVSALAGLERGGGGGRGREGEGEGGGGRGRREREWSVGRAGGRAGLDESLLKVDAPCQIRLGVDWNGANWMSGE